MDKNAQIKYIEEKLGYDRPTIRALGISQCMLQIAAREGMPDVLRCDADSGMTGQYVGDILKDLKTGRNERR